MDQVSGTQGYAEVAPILLEREASIPFLSDHESFLHLIPPHPCDVVDIGAGTGRAAAWFADAGHRVVAVEPVDELRTPAMVRPPSPAIEWLDDALPGLAVLRSRGRVFDVVLLTAVWMHLDRARRKEAMPNIARLVDPEGVVLMSLRHGPAPPLRQMFDVTADETITLASEYGLRPIVNVSAASVQQVNRDAGVTWTRLAFTKG